MEEEKKEYEHVNSPSHYNNYSIEVIDMMVNNWGVDNTITFCEMNAFKYRMRMGTKPDQPIERDLEKEKWYLDKANELRESKKHDSETWNQLKNFKDAKFQMIDPTLNIKINK